MLGLELNVFRREVKISKIYFLTRNYFDVDIMSAWSACLVDERGFADRAEYSIKLENIKIC